MEGSSHRQTVGIVVKQEIVDEVEIKEEDTNEDTVSEQHAHQASVKEEDGGGANVEEEGEEDVEGANVEEEDVEEVKVKKKSKVLTSGRNKWTRYKWKRSKKSTSKKENVNDNKEENVDGKAIKREIDENKMPSATRGPVPFREFKSTKALAADLEKCKAQSYVDTTFSGPSASRTGAPQSSGSSTIRSIAWSALGTQIATADSRILRVWNPERYNVKFSMELKPGSSSNGAVTGARHPAPASHLTGTEKVAWCPTNDFELASVGNDGMLRLWDARQGSRGSCTAEVKLGGEGFSMAWSPDGKDVVVGRKDDAIIPVSRATLTPIATHQQNVRTDQIAFSNSGKEFFLTMGDGGVRIVDYPTFEHLHTMNAHTSAAHCVAQSFTGRYIATGGADAMIKLWDTSCFICARTITDISGPVRSLGFSFDGSYIVGGSDEADKPYGLAVTFVETGEVIYKVPTTGPASQVAWHPSRYLLAYGGEGGLKIHGAAGGPL